MTAIEQQTIHIRNSDGAINAGRLQVNVYSGRERMIRAAKTLGVLWGLAIVTLFIPIAHFILVPGFLIAGPIMAYSRYRVVSLSDHAEGECPTCHKQVEIPVEPSEKPPVWTYCPSCNASLHLQEHPTDETGAK